MKCPYCGNQQAEPPKCNKCYAAIEKPVEKAKAETPKSEAKLKKGGKR